MKQQDISQLARPPVNSSSVFESSQSQQFSSVQQSSTSFSQTQSTNQIYESQEFNGGVMKGYKAKDEFSSENGETRNVRDSGIFTGINGDSNALVDEEFDRKKHTVKDLAKHFALVKPKQNIPHNILPEQRIYNGDQGPALNYLGASEAGGLVQTQTRREMSQQDVEASKAAYEMKKKQQMEQQSSTTTTTTTSSSSSSSTVVKRTESSSRSEMKSERRMSLRDSLMLDPAQAHAEAGLIDPSAILRGEAVTRWTPVQSPQFPVYKSQHNGDRLAPVMAPVMAPVKTSTLPRSSVTLPQPSVPTLVEPAQSPTSHMSAGVVPDHSFLSPPDILHGEAASPDYAATVQASSKTFAPPALVLEPEASTAHTTRVHVAERACALQTQQLAGSLSSPEVSRSSATTPAPTTPFPSLEVRPRTPLLVTTRPSSVILDRTRHVSKDDIAKMMAELNEPLPPMLDIPQEIRASPLIFAGGLATVSHPSSCSSSSCLPTSSSVTASSSSRMPVRLILYISTQFTSHDPNSHPHYSPGLLSPE